MLISSLVAALHFLALAVGFGAVFARGVAMRKILALPSQKQAALRQLFFADNAWGVAALLWILTGLARAFGGLEKGTAFYLANPLFHLKLGLFGLIFALELWPMILFVKWRIRLVKGKAIESTDVLSQLKWVNDAEVILIVAIVFVASAMARGL